MRLYAGISRHFIDQAIRNRIAGMLREAFFAQFRYQPSPGEVQSWQNSLRVMANVLEAAALVDSGVILEYQLPLSSLRLDFLLCGRDSDTRDRAVIVELKQWSGCSDAPGENEVVTWIAGNEREVLHPSVQVDHYRTYLQDIHTAFHDGPERVELDACAYLHNYEPAAADVLFGEKFAATRENAPVFTADDFDSVAGFLEARLSHGGGGDVLAKIENSRYRPSRKLMDHVARTIRERSEYTLLDEQLVVFDRVMSLVRPGLGQRGKTAVIVKGGPGTGKSVVAINLMAELLRSGFNAHYATNSKAFTHTLKSKIGSRGGIQFNFFSSYDRAKPNEIDVLVCDEAHRLKRQTRIPYQPPRDRPQLEEVVNAARVTVLFIDDLQVVRPEEVGSVETIRSGAEELGCTVLEYELEAQFRCAGSDAFVSWIDSTLGLRRTATPIWDDDPAFDFRIMASPLKVEEAIRARVAEGATGRMTAGFCWPWSRPDPKTFQLVEDVVLGDYRRPWNANSRAGRLAPGIPKETLWATDPAGIDQVGCVYTAQGFEWDYVGVIVGPDLTYDFDARAWTGHPEASHDSAVKRAGASFGELIRRTYRVLLSRGMKGCYVYFADRDAERFFRSRMA
ncbi:MAG TPA: DUF2075 domain-containing protein [Longimicrobiaceae bacterium]|nr:DUF2075 domain-containing protein [Longimicrobiaceae bacterium]